MYSRHNVNNSSNTQHYEERLSTVISKDRDIGRELRKGVGGEIVFGELQIA